MFIIYKKMKAMPHNYNKISLYALNGSPKTYPIPLKYISNMNAW